MSEAASGESRVEMQVQQVLRALADRGNLGVAPHELEEAVRDRVAGWQGAPVQDFVPLLVERRLREQVQNPAAG